ncbi:MAG TPA: PSD1 and planctomycete cytochrome C domain-containing protein [Pirellulaceae bacterium]|nr:PSD1 and planctomycete cytochrome C domain-containing protein [Pirellulaceae bacterium]
MKLAVPIALAFTCGSLLAGYAAGQEVDYSRDVKPLLVRHCSKCHGPDKQENGLRVDAAALALRGGDGGAAIVPGKPAQSLLIRAVKGDEELSKMPPEDEPQLSAEQIGLLAKWVEAGALHPAEERPTPSSKANHWSFHKPVRAALPSVSRRDWTRNSIDSFILARLETQGIGPSTEASRETLIRRLYLDLIGLLPAPDGVDAFVADAAPDAYERQADRLLASCHYGERWGRHWLDVARYADSNGYTRDFGRQIWKYREWVIEAINAGKPFDEFAIEQMAGDMLERPTTSQLVATGFHRNTLINEEGGTDQEQFRVEAVVDRVSTTGSAFLGLTLGCARCHSHKYDPITQAEFYEIFALLNNCDEPTIEAPSSLQIASGELKRREEIRQKIKDLDVKVEAGRGQIEEAQREWEATITPQQRARLPGPVQVAYDMPFEKRDAANKKLIEDHYRDTDDARRRFPLLEEVVQLKQQEPKIPSTMILRERQEPRETFVHKRGDFLDHGARVTGNSPAVLPPLVSLRTTAAGTRKVSTSGFDRLDFARWLVSADNPLTPRVVMNRDWQKLFGRGIVETEDDFGLQGTPPAHPELLDWLACEFVSTEWDTKAMHRRMVQSATYRQSSNVRTDLAERDPQNKLLARQNRLRLDAEIVRDVALSAAGLLTETLGGPSVFPPQPDGVFDFTQDPKPWKAATGGDRYRRGMYTHFWRSSPYPSLTVFDAPNANVTCTRRVRSNTPLQSLTMANDQAFFECAQAMAGRVLAAPMADDAGRLAHAFQLCMSREPAASEAAVLAEVLAAERKTMADDPATAEALVSRETCPDDTARRERAAWTSVCRVLLNLDEMITRE